MVDGLSRHTLVTPSVSAWAAVMAARPDLAAEPLVAQWAAARRPLITRRPVQGDAPGTIPLGLPLPPSHGKRRIALTLRPGEICDIRPPPQLADAIGVAPAAWQNSIVRLLRLDRLTRVFGSLAWQHLTGLTYLSESSDLDLLWRRPTEALLVGIAAIALDAPMRIDGEILGAAGGVQWRELWHDDVLVKGPDGVRAMAREHFLAGAD